MFAISVCKELVLLRMVLVIYIVKTRTNVERVHLKKEKTRLGSYLFCILKIQTQNLKFL